VKQKWRRTTERLSMSRDTENNRGVKPIFYGHACIKQYSSNGSAVLMDPWFSRHGAFFGSWFQFPENTPLLDEALDHVTDICISHNHADHFDPETLRYAFSSNPSLKLHIPKYSTGWFLRRVHHFLPDLGQRVVEHDPFERFTVASDVSCFFVPEESPGEIDSAIICCADGKTLVNLNDSRLNFEQLIQIRAVAEGVDFLALQGSGASEYPITYTYSDKDMRSRCLRKRRDKLNHCTTFIGLLEPERILFFAGPPAFLDESLERFNERGPASVFPDQLDIVREIERDRPAFAARTLFLLPGDEFDDKYLWKETDLKSKRLLPYTQKSGYLDSYRKQRRDTCTLDWGDPIGDELLLRYFNEMATCSAYMSEKIGGEVSFIVKGRSSSQAFTVDFVTSSARKGISHNSLYAITAPAAALRAVLERTATWDDILLSLRVAFDEKAANYIPHLKPLLRYMDTEVFVLLERYERQLEDPEAESSFMEVRLGDDVFHIQRFCPHAGNDLQHNGRVNEDGTITCLAHRLCFDIKTGECVNAKGYRLKVRIQDSYKVVGEHPAVMPIDGRVIQKGTARG
jgi:UDP-MurNAc hydroxylase